MATFVPDASRRAFVPAIPPVRDMTPVLDAQEVVTKLSAKMSLRDVLTDGLLDSVELDELLEARNLIESRIPPSSLKDVDLERELVLQFKALQALQARVLGDLGTSPQHRAQVANSLSAALANLSKVQASVYSSERSKRLEALQVRMLQKLPPDVVSEFMDLYESEIVGEFSAGIDADV